MDKLPGFDAGSTDQDTEAPELEAEPAGEENHNGSARPIVVAKAPRKPRGPRKPRKPSPANPLEPEAIGTVVGEPAVTSPFAAAAPASASPMANGLDLDNLRIAQDFGSGLPVERALTDLDVRKPNRDEWFRVHPTLMLATGCFTPKDGSRGDTYIVTTSIQPYLGDACDPTLLRLTLNRQGDWFVWPLRLPPPQGETSRMRWHSTARAAAEEAVGKWTRLTASMSDGAYRTYFATVDLGEPKWPSIDIHRMVTLAFADRVISSVDHPVIAKRDGKA
jgi:hypothetical protein